MYVAEHLVYKLLQQGPNPPMTLTSIMQCSQYIVISIQIIPTKKIWSN